MSVGKLVIKYFNKNSVWVREITARTWLVNNRTKPFVMSTSALNSKIGFFCFGIQLLFAQFGYPTFVFITDKIMKG